MIEIIKDNILIFDLIVLLVTIYAVIQCTGKGFTLSLLSFSKWLISLMITIVSVPKLTPLVQNYIESDFIADVGLGIFIFIISLFIIINISKAIKSTVTWSGLGAVDKTFGFIFGIFKSYIICVCIFSLLNWFYPHQKWPFKTEGAYTFQIIYNGSNFLIEELPKSDDYYDDTKNKIEQI